MFDTESFAEIISLARQVGIDPAALLAVAEVESGGRALFDINGKKEPVTRFEGHYFDRRLAGRIHDQARQTAFSAPEAGACAIQRSSANAGFCLSGRCLSIRRRRLNPPHGGLVR